MDFDKAVPVRVRYIWAMNKDLHTATGLGQLKQVHTCCNQDDQEQQLPLPRRHIQSSRWITHHSAGTKVALCVSALRWHSLGCGNHCEVVVGIPGGGNAGRHALTLADKSRSDMQV